MPDHDTTATNHPTGLQYTLHGYMPVRGTVTLAPEEATFTDEALDRHVREGRVDWTPDGAPVVERVMWPVGAGCA